MRYYAHLFEGGIPPQFTLNCSARKIFLFLLIISVIYLYKYGLNGYLFYTLGYNPILPYLFCCLNWFILPVWRYFYLVLVSLFQILIIVVLWIFCEHFLTFVHWNMLKFHPIYVLFLVRVHVSMELCFLWRTVLETSIGALDMLVTTGVSLFLDSLTEQGIICV